MITEQMGKTMIKRMLNSKDFKIEHRTNSEGQKEYVFEGYAIVFNQRTSIANCFYEEIDPHAFRNSDMSTVFLFANHQANEIPLAAYRPEDDANTMEITIDEVGLYFRAIVDVENNSIASAAKLIAFL